MTLDLNTDQYIHMLINLRQPAARVKKGAQYIRISQTIIVKMSNCN